MSRLDSRTDHLDHKERDQIRALYGSLRRYAAVVGPAEVDPDDLVQEALLRTLRQGPLSALTNPGAYLRRTILNLASNERRRLGRLRRAIHRLGEDEYGEEVYISDLADLLTVSPRTRAVLFLTAVEGYSFRETSEIVGCTEVAARKIASRGRKKLRASHEAEVQT